MKKNILSAVLLFVFMFLSDDVKAVSCGGCECSEITRLKSIVSNINISYDYYMHDDTAYFNITLTNLVPEIYFIDYNNYGRVYTYKDTINGEITIPGNIYTKGTYVFYSALNNCYGTKLGSKYYRLPKYNYYHNDELCEGIEDYSLCKKWTEVSYSRKDFEKLINEYKMREEKEKAKLEAEYKENIFTRIIQFYVKYYYFILIGIIFTCVVIIIINSNRNKFKL